MASSKLGSPQLGKTLQDLEAAFADWDALSSEPAEPTPKEAPVKKNSDSKDNDLRKKTKKLLDQLRQQLADLEK